MGAYLSEPITDKVSTDEVGKRVICGASSMQGWRVTQEDAHNCSLEYDTDTSFFAVYDGHGGHEVAAYSAQHLPLYLKNCEAYKKGDYTEALKDSFLEFDAILTTPKVVAVLKQIASNKDGEQNSGSGSLISNVIKIRQRVKELKDRTEKERLATAEHTDERADGQDEEEEENVKNLYEEAQMPLEQVMAKYQNDLLNPNVKKLKQDDGKPPVSPFLRGRRSCSSGASSSGSGSSSSKSSTSTLSESGNGSTESDPDAENTRKERDSEVSSSSQGQSNSACKSKQHLVNNEADQTSDSSTSNGESKGLSEAREEVETSKRKATMPDSSGDANIQSTDKTADHSEEGNSPVKVKDAGDVKQEVNGEMGEGGKKDAGQTAKDCEGVTSSSTPHENGEVVKGESKGKSPSKISSSSVESSKEDKKRTSLRRRSATALYRTLLGGQDQSDSDSDDEGDENFQGVDNSSDEDDEEDDGGEEGDAEEEEDNDNDEEEEDEDDDSMVDDEEDEDDNFTMAMPDEPGSDSGCTAVVALLKDQELYVANAGDSRCVVCRKGQAIEMSLDHKPEDEAEMERIVKAGGKVTADGRVNGGLNLSRALGDHAYKQSKDLSAQEQMITALPDVRTLMIDPAEDEFMVLACDGIWNFMSSQEVVDFVRPRIQEGQTKLSQICEELFDHCLAPNTIGDGTGCDNMTAVIVQFRPELVNQSESKSVKRAASPAIESSSDTTKRPKIEETETATCV